MIFQLVGGTGTAGCLTPWLFQITRSGKPTDGVDHEWPICLLLAFILGTSWTIVWVALQGVVRRRIVEMSRADTIERLVKILESGLDKIAQGLGRIDISPTAREGQGESGTLPRTEVDGEAEDGAS